MTVGVNTCCNVSPWLKMTGSNTYQHRLEWAVVNLRYHHLDSKRHCIKRRKYATSSQCKWYLKGLSDQSLPGGENLDDFSSHRVFRLRLGLESGTFALDLGDITNIPAYSEVDFLTLPLLDEDNRPKAVENSKDR
jgi:hypothetical protein